MSPLFIVVLVLFTLVMGVWLLTLLSVVSSHEGRASAWLGFFACLLLGIVVFLLGIGVITYRAV